MDVWASYKKGFYAWESATAQWTEQVLRSPFVLQPAGAALSAMMRAKADADRRSASLWSAVGLPTRHDQERMLHAINQLNSRILDLEEQLAAAHDKEPV